MNDEKQRMYRCFFYMDACMKKIGQLDTIAGDGNALQFPIISQLRSGA